MTRVDKIGIFVAPPVLFMAALLHVYLPAESDKGWLLHAARMVLEGRRLDVDIIEINPPLIVWLYMAPVWISQHVPGIEDFEVLAFVGLAFCFLSVAVCTLLMRRHPGFAGNIWRQAELAVLLAMVFVFYNTQPYFFDREHIFLVLTFPYMLRFMPSLADEKPALPLRIVTGLFAALGYCIKPHTVIVFAAIQLFCALREQTLRVLFNLENLIIVCGVLLYMGCIWHFTPQYFVEIMPMAVATYFNYGNKGSGYVYFPPVAVSLGVIFADFRMWYVTPYRRDVYYFIWLTFALLVYALANNGWGYTYNPLLCMILVVAGWMLWEYYWLKTQHDARDLATRRFSFGMRGCILVLAVNAAYMAVYIIILSVNLTSIRSPCENNPGCWTSKGPYIQYVHQNDIHSFGTISFDFSNWILLMRMTGAEWDTRFNHLWMLPEMMRQGDDFIDEHYWILAFVANGLARDLDDRKPELVFVDSSPGFQGHIRYYDLLSLLQRVPQFKEAWSHYRYAVTLGACVKEEGLIPSECKFDTFRRVP